MDVCSSPVVLDLRWIRYHVEISNVSNVVLQQLALMFSNDGTKAQGP